MSSPVLISPLPESPAASLASKEGIHEGIHIVAKAAAEPEITPAKRPYERLESPPHMLMYRDVETGKILQATIGPRRSYSAVADPSYHPE